MLPLTKHTWSPNCRTRTCCASKHRQNVAKRIVSFADDDECTSFCCGLQWVSFTRCLLVCNSSATGCCIYTVQEDPKNGTIILYASTLLTDFQNYFTVKIRRKFLIIKVLITPQVVAILFCEMLSVLKATIEKKTTSVTTHLKKN